MNPTRDEILRMLMVMVLRHSDSESAIQALNLLEYTDPFTISDDGSDDLKIPYVGYVKRLINETTSQAVNIGIATEADFVDDGFGEGGKKLILPFTGTQITIAEISRSSTGVLLKQSAGGSVEEINGLTSDPQTLTYWYVGEPEEG